MRATIRNDFHNTEAKINIFKSHNGRLLISDRQVVRVRAKLCGIADCQCGGDLGQRGKQDFEIITHQDRNGKLYAEIFEASHD